MYILECIYKLMLNIKILLNGFFNIFYLMIGGGVEEEVIIYECVLYMRCFGINYCLFFVLCCIKD